MEFAWLSSRALAPLRSQTLLFLLLFFAQFLACCWCYFRIPLRGKASLFSMLAFALLFRLTLIPAPPDESEDVYRYIWDARVARTGISPYAYPPNAPELERLRDDRIYPSINSKPYITAYPPVSQVLFRLSVFLFGESETGMKAIFSLLEFGALLLAWRLLGLIGGSIECLFLVAWNPFFIFEFSHSGHSESAMMFLVLLALLLLHGSSKVAGMVAYIGAVLVKLHPALWFPLFVRHCGLRASAACIFAGAVLLQAFFSPQEFVRYLNSLRLYLQLFEFNAGIHYLFRFAGQIFFNQAWDKLIGPYLAAALIVTTLLICWRFPVHDTPSLLHAVFWISVADLCLATTVHPWYLSWAAFALPFFPYAFMFYWTGASALSYMAYAYLPVREPSWVLLLEYLPMYALMFWEIRKREPLLPVWRAALNKPD